MASKGSTSRKSGSGENLCSSHPSDKIQMYCGNCDQAVCLKCIASGHRGHHFDMIEDIMDQKRTEMTKYTEKVEKKISSVTSSIQVVRINHRDYSEAIETQSDKINNKRKKLKQQIDDIADTILVQLHLKAENDLRELNTRETSLTQEQSELKDFLQYCRDKMDSMDNLSIVQLVEESKQKEKKFKSSETPMTIFPPHFADGTTDVGQLREAFGQLIKDDIESSSDFVESIHSDVKFTIDPTAVTNIKPAIATTRVSTVGEEKAWVGHYGNPDVALVNRDSQLLHKVNLGFISGDITTTSTGELLVTDHNEKNIKKYTRDGQFVNIIYTSQYETRGLCVTSDNEILVCLWKSTTDSEVIRLPKTGKVKQTIKYDQHNKPLFTCPDFVTENVNKDVCVLDSYKTLVVVNKDGHLRFRYPKLYTTTGSIHSCYGIECDQLGFILLSDYKNHRILLIDINGNFIQYLLTLKQGIMYPRGLSVNCKGELWLCNKEASEVRVVKYRS